MKQSVLDTGLWASSVAGECALVFVVFWKRRWTSFPCFCSIIGLNLITDVLSSLLSSRLPEIYKHIYWGYYVVNIVLQAAVVFELAAVVLRPTGTWVRDARKQFITWGAAGAMIALTLSYMVAPPAASLVQGFALRADLFTSLLICELILVASMSATRLGLGWKNHVIAIGQGLTGWAIIAVVIDSIHSYFGAIKFFRDTEAGKTLAYLGALTYWRVQLWHEEPARKPIDPELRKYIVALHRRVQYDLGEAEQ